jgi:hypothetical protein
MEFLGMTDHGQQRKGWFHHHAVIPCALLTQFDIGWDSTSTTKAPISQPDTLLVKILQQV